MILSVVKGATCVVSPIHCAVRPLKADCSASQVLDGSQAASNMVPGSAAASWVLLSAVKKTDIAESRPFVRVFHVEFVFV